MVEKVKDAGVGNNGSLVLTYGNVRTEKEGEERPFFIAYMVDVQ